MTNRIQRYSDHVHHVGHEHDPASEPTRSPHRAEQADGHIRFVYDSDHQHHFAARTTPIQSITFDRRISVSVQPSAVDLASVILHREVESDINSNFSDHIRRQLGDVIDTSNIPEWVLYTLSTIDDPIFEQLFDLPTGYREWNDDQWDAFFSRLNDRDWATYLDVILRYYEESSEELPLAAEGNHDGAAWGNGLNNLPSLLSLKLQIASYAMQRGQIERRIDRLERRLDSADSTESPRLTQKLSDLRSKLATVDDRLVEVSTQESKGILTAFYSKQQQRIQKQISHLHLKLEQINTPSPRRERITNTIERLERRLTYVQEKLETAKRSQQRVRDRINEYPLKRGRFRLPQVLTNVFLGINKTRKIYDPSGYWAQNAGAPTNTFDKSDYIHQYLRLHFPELDLTAPESIHDHNNHDGSIHDHHHVGLQPLVRKFLAMPSNERTETAHFVVEKTQANPQTGQAMRNADGSYVTEITPALDFSDHSASSVHERFEALWQEVRPGEFVCLIDLPGQREEYPQQHYIFLQAAHVGEVAGRPVYDIILDGMDGTEQRIDLAYFGFLSSLAKDCVQTFMEQMRLTASSPPLFSHTSHFALRAYAKDYWKKFGWQDHFAQEDVLPFLFCGHGHAREIIDETKPHLYNTRLFFGVRSVKRDDGFFSLMSPSAKDHPNEFMSVDLTYDDSTNEFVLTQAYHEIVTEDEISDIAPQVVQTVENYADVYSHQRYHDYAEINTGLFSGVQNIFFSQDRILTRDAIPLSVEQFKETLSYAKAYLYFLTQEFGNDDAFTRMVEHTVIGLNEHLERWLNGNPDADNEFDRMGYEAAKIKAESTPKRRDRYALLTNFNDIFDTPFYDRLRLLIAQTPNDSNAYDFWLLLGKRAAEQEATPKMRERHQTRADAPDQTQFRFQMTNSPS